MLFYTLKLLLSAGMIVLVSEVSKRFPTLGGLLASLPLSALLGILWLYGETGDIENISSHSLAVFWFVLVCLAFFASLSLFALAFE